MQQRHAAEDAGAKQRSGPVSEFVRRSGGWAPCAGPAAHGSPPLPPDVMLHCSMTDAAWQAHATGKQNNARAARIHFFVRQICFLFPHPSAFFCPVLYVPYISSTYQVTIAQHCRAI